MFTTGGKALEWGGDEDWELGLEQMLDQKVK